LTSAITTMGNKKSKGSENDKLSDQGLFYRNILSL